MCCDLPEAVLVPPAVAEMLAEYRTLQSTSIVDWGHEVPTLPGALYGRFLDLGRLWAAAKDAVPALTAALHDDSPAVRREAASALKEIDPEAAKKAGVR